MEVDYFN